MRYFLFILACMLFICCQTETKNNKPSWLVGKWKRINEKPDKSTFDYWNKDLTGIGFTLKEKDTIFKEIMSIVTIKDTLHLKIDGVNETLTLFKFTKQTDSSFVCENLENEFPKKIYYFLDNHQLKCKISNDEFLVDFVFNKQHK